MKVVCLGCCFMMSLLRLLTLLLQIKLLVVVAIILSFIPIVNCGRYQYWTFNDRNSPPLRQQQRLPWDFPTGGAQRQQQQQHEVNQAQQQQQIDHEDYMPSSSSSENGMVIPSPSSILLDPTRLDSIENRMTNNNRTASSSRLSLSIGVLRPSWNDENHSADRVASKTRQKFLSSSSSVSFHSPLPAWLTETTGSIVFSQFCNMDKKRNNNDTTTTLSYSEKIFQFDNAISNNSTTSMAAMAETLALICDVVILMMKPSSSSPDIANAIRRGLQRRRRANLVGTRQRPRPVMVVVVVIPSSSSEEENGGGVDDSADDPNEIRAWKDQVVLYDMASLTPDLVERLELVTLRELGPLLSKDVMTNYNPTTTTQNHDDDDEEVAWDLEMFPALLQEVYRSLSGNSNDATTVTSMSVPQALRDPNERLPTRDDALQQQHPSTLHTRFSSTQQQASTKIAILVQQVVMEAQRRMDGIESRQQQIWLDDTASPMLEFGSMIEEILIDSQTQLQSIYNNNDMDQEGNAESRKEQQQQLQHDVLMRLAIQLRQLYQVQLQTLREHFGRQYDTILESTNNEGRWTAAAADITERFRIAAQHAIPTLCRQDGVLRDADFSYLPTLYGLISDMTQATSLRQDLETSLTNDLDDDAHDDDDDNVGTRKKHRKNKKWYHKVAARGLVLGVNYLQGWLAWKALQRAADERDRNVPKFPLF